MTIKAQGYAAKHSFSRLKPFAVERDEAGPNEVEIEVLYSGVCHSDIHQCENDWGNTVFPCMPGHEIVGRIAKAGTGVTLHQVGDLVGVGCMVDSCRECAPCRAGEEQYCEGPNSWLATYNGPNVPAAKAKTGGNMYSTDHTFGGYSNVIVVKEDFVLRIPSSLPPQAAAPILCAGVTTYSPMKHWGVKPGHKVGVVGLGGLGDMAVKIAIALGAEVTVFTTTREKVAEAQKLGAAGVLEGDTEAFEALEKRFDLILSTIPEKHKIDPFVPLLAHGATYVAVGALVPMPGWNHQEVIMGRRSIAGSLFGSIRETQEVLDFCAEHGIRPEVEVIAIQDINEAFRRVKEGEVRFRYVIDAASIGRELEDA